VWSLFGDEKGRSFLGMRRGDRYSRKIDFPKMIAVLKFNQQDDSVAEGTAEQTALINIPKIR